MKNLKMTGFSKGLLCVGSSLLLVGLVEAKPDNGKGKGGKGGGNGQGHSQKEDHGKDHGKGAGKSDDKKSHDHGAAWKGKRFEDSERSLFSSYFDQFESSPQGLPPGLAKNLKRGKPLPPGWQKKVTEGYIIEDSIFDFFQPLDEALFPKYKRVPDTKLYMYGDRVVRVYEPRRQVIDIFQIPSIKLY